VVYGTDAQLAKDISKDDVERVIVQLILDGILVGCFDLISPFLNTNGSDLNNTLDVKVFYRQVYVI